VIAILVHNPNYAASTELVKAFSLIGPVDLISLERGHEMYQRDPGHIVGPDSEDCREMVTRADLVVFGDASAFFTLGALWHQDAWDGVLRGKRMLALLGDTEYITRPRWYADLCEELHIRQFAMPGYRPLNMAAIPFHHPFEWAGEIIKPETTLVMHTPAQQNKCRMKGTQAIENAVAAVRQDYAFTYERYQELPYNEALLMKSRAHIFFDQFTPATVIPCLGRNGVEALAMGAVVLSSIYEPEMVKGFFDMPPVVALHDEVQMRAELARLVGMSADALALMGSVGRAWATDNVSYQAWIKYIVRYL
jgi:hypothetical protein